MISAKNTGCPSRGSVTCIGLVRVTIPNERLEILVETTGNSNVLQRITINGIPDSTNGDRNIYQSDSVDIERAGGCPVINLKTYGIRLTFGRYYRVRVTTSTTNIGQLCGLLGTYNNNATDDLQTPDGNVVSTINEFGNSWLLPDPTTPGCEGTGGPSKRNAEDIEGCSTDPDVIAEAQQKCAFLMQQPFTPCNNVVDPSEYITVCEFQYRCVNETERQEFLCGDFSSYAAECADAGLTISSWRLPSNCCKFIIFNYIVAIATY